VHVRDHQLVVAQQAHDRVRLRLAAAGVVLDQVDQQRPAGAVDVALLEILRAAEEKELPFVHVLNRRADHLHHQLVAGLVAVPADHRVVGLVGPGGEGEEK